MLPVETSLYLSKKEQVECLIADKCIVNKKLSFVRKTNNPKYCVYLR